jgi:hypothetical protein
VAATVTGIVMAAVLPVPAYAADIPVGCSATELIAAVEAANDEATHPGGDTIKLQAGCTYSFTERYGGTEDALPDIHGGLIIQGNGARLERADGSVSFGLVDVPGDLFISDVTLAEFWGFDGAYIHTSGSTVLVDSVITNVPPTGQQAAALHTGPSADLAVVDSIIENQCNCDHDGGAGGAISNEGNLFVLGSTFTNNSVRKITPGPGLQVGGAIENTGTAEIFDSTFTNNFSGATGGAIRNGAGDLKIYDSSFVGNSANFGGAIRSSSASDLLVEDSYFEDNEAFLSGGAIDNGSDSIAKIVNSTFYRNEAGAGTGGALLNDHAARVEYSTFSGNSASDGGGSLSSPAGLIAAEASIVDGGASPCEGEITDFDGNIVYPARDGCPDGFTVANPLLRSPALRGGTTKTMSLGEGSAAFDHVSPTGCPPADQRGLVRPVGPSCDAGALEDQVPTTPGAPGLSSGSNPNNTGAFRLAWTAATDPDDAPTYRLFGKDQDDADFGLIASPASAGFTFGAPGLEGEGTHRYRVQAVGGNNASGFSAQSEAIVVDLTPPSAPTPAPDRDPDYQPATGLGWYRDQVTVSFTAGSDPVLADGSPGSGAASTSAPQTFTTSGPHTASGETTDHASNVSTSATFDVQVDADPPSVAFASCPESALLGSDLTLQWDASDAHSGLATAPTGTIPVDTSTVGLRTLTTPAAMDNVGLSASAVCEVSVIYDFKGFLQPVANAPELNDARAGAPIRISFSLDGDQGLDVFTPGYPASDQISCASPPELSGGTPTESARGLSFAGGSHGGYTYLWNTARSWAGTCRQLVVLLDDGTFHRANFDFR